MSATTQITVDGKTFTSGILAITAAVLFVGLMLVMQQPVQATGQSDRAGDYKMLTQQITRSKELVVVLDGAAKRAIIYDFDMLNRRMSIAQVMPLDRLPKPPAEDDRRARGGQGQP